jgi:PAS domain S-box-containing protein
VQPPPQIAIERPVIESDEAFLRWHPLSYFAEPRPERVPTRYRVNRGEWSNWDYTHEVVLHNLTAGSYFFQIQARNLFGVVDDAGQLGTFVVAPPFYLRAAFFAPIALLVLALGLTGFIYLLAVRRKGRELAKSEAKFRRLTESTFDGIVIYAHGNVLEANDSAARMFGYEPKDFVGKPISSLLSSYERQPERKRSEDFVQQPIEARGYRRDGQVFWIEIVENDIPFNGTSGGMARIAAIRNITERKEAEEQFAHYQEELKALVLELSNIEEHERKKLATYLHDYLSQALGFCRMKLGTMHGAINEADVRQIKEYVEDMFEKTQTLTFELSPPILYELGLEAALSSLAERMQSEHGIAFACEFEEPPVDLAENLSLLMFYSVRELCINVVKHARATKVDITLEQTENYLHARVADNGIGFNAAASSVPQRTRGGFGLFNIHERLSHLGGRLDIRPRPGGGTAVTISLPLEQDEPAHTTRPIL